MCNWGEMFRDEFLNEGRIVGHQEGRKEGLQEGFIDATFNNAMSIVEKLHFDFKRALILLDITDPKEQEFYLKKYEALNSNH